MRGKKGFQIICVCVPATEYIFIAELKYVAILSQNSIQAITRDGTLDEVAA